MCGIVGFIDLQRQTATAELERRIHDMSRVLAHRGPDDKGAWMDATTGIALGHRRLSILDLSTEGHQPMQSANGRYVLVFNGEIYNFVDLRNQLAALGHSFRGHSDTEVMLAAFEQWGVESAVKKFVGMFAFAVWDREQRALILGRDRMGEKPLYYGQAPSLFLFASELKAFHSHPDWIPEIDRDAIALFMRYGYIPAPYSIYKSVCKLPPGNLLTFRVEPGNLPLCTPYWSLKSLIESSTNRLPRISDGETIEELDHILTDAIKLQMVADVPLGAFLSGGIDSSLVVAVMQAHSLRPVKTFTIGFPDTNEDESLFAQKISQLIGTDHTMLKVTPEDALAVVPRLPDMYDEPFADSSQIPTFLVSKLARKSVTVSLSGDGGDELFAGYSRYAEGLKWLRRIHSMPIFARQALSHILSAPVASATDQGLECLGATFPSKWHQGSPGSKMCKLSAALQSGEPEGILDAQSSLWHDHASLVPGSQLLPTPFSRTSAWAQTDSPLHRAMYLDTAVYLPNDILVKVDRAAMAVSLETRIPLLDHRVVEFAWSLPPTMKIRGREGKWALRKLLDRYLPRDLFSRPKMGFRVPLSRWLRGPLHDWAEALLNEQRLRQEGWLNAQMVRKTWYEHSAGFCNRQYPLWNVLIFQAWQEKQSRSG